MKSTMRPVELADKWISRLALFLQARPFAVIAGYFFVQAFVLSIIVPGAGVDYGEQISFVGDLAWGYGGSQPPLYSWLVNGFVAIFGLSMPVLIFLKFTLLTITVLAVHQSILKLSGEKAIAMASAMGLFLLPAFGWEAQRALTHTVLAVTGSALFLLALVTHFEKRVWLSATAIGAAAAIAFLGKYNAVIFIVGVITAIGFIPLYRSKFTLSHVLIALAVFLMITSPHLFWMAEHPYRTFAKVSKLEIVADGPYLLTRTSVLFELIKSSIVFTSLFAGIALIALYLSRGEISKYKLEFQKAKLLIFAVVFSICAFAIVMLASGATRVSDRWLVPILFVVPATTAVYLAAIGKQRLFLNSITGWGFIIAICAMPILWFNQLYGTQKYPSIALYNYETAFKDLKFEKINLIASNDSVLLGNLKLTRQDLTVLHWENSNWGTAIESRPLIITWVGSDISEQLEYILATSNISTKGLVKKTLEIEHIYRPDNKILITYVVLP